MINAFAVHLLLPGASVTKMWDSFDDPRLAAVAAAVRFRASWTAVCSQLKNLGLIDETRRSDLATDPPTGADFVELGERWISELDPPAVPPEYGRRLLAASPHWLEVVELREVDEVVAFARYKAELGGGPDQNTGEAAVLGRTAVHGGIAIIDERAGTRMAQRDGIVVHGTLWLVANGVRSEKLSRLHAERMIDELAATDMALSVDGAGFLAWAYEEGLLP